MYSRHMENMDIIISLLKRRGFIWQSSEIYGGAAHAYDYGPLGTLVKNNLKNFWLKSMVKADETIVPLDSSIFMHPRVWEASGHVENFTDPLVECEKCKRRFKQQDVSDSCPACEGNLGEARTFNLMFKTHLGASSETSHEIYLRPETAQGIYVDYKLVQQTMRLKLPFGIAQVGKAFRNEITPSNFTYRTVEFEQMEQQFFVHPKDADKWFDTWRERREGWYTRSLGIQKKHIQTHPHSKEELAHYAKAAVDIQFEFPFGWQEIEGIHNRGDWDLSRHQDFSGTDMSYFDEETEEKVMPYIIETSAGADRVLLAMLIDAYHEEEIEGEKRAVLKLHPYFSPYRAAIFPLVKKDEKLVSKTRDLFASLRINHSVVYDESGSIGRRYRRHDEVGTPWCVTVDGQTLEDGTVTVRDRDTLKQERVHADELSAAISDKVKSSLNL